MPRVNGDWGDCDPKNKKNKRLRCSLLVERAENKALLDAGQVTRLLIDTAPDLREQLLEAGITNIDAVAYTHTHADQCHGIDDLRAIVYTRGSRLTAFMDQETEAELIQRFGYIFQTPEGSLYPPLMDRHVFQRPGSFQIDGKGGCLEIQAFPVDHGRLTISGFRMGPLAYTPDVSELTDSARDTLHSCPVWIVDALREKPHPTHAHVDRSLEWIADLDIAAAILTNLHIDLDYDALRKRCPEHVRPAYDGLSVTVLEDTGSIISIDPV